MRRRAKFGQNRSNRGRDMTIFEFSKMAANEQMIKFWWRSRSRIRIRVRHALAEVCTVPVLLVIITIIFNDSSVFMLYLWLCCVS